MRTLGNATAPALAPAPRMCALYLAVDPTGNAATCPNDGEASWTTCACDAEHIDGAPCSA